MNQLNSQNIESNLINSRIVIEQRWQALLQQEETPSASTAITPDGQVFSEPPNKRAFHEGLREIRATLETLAHIQELTKATATQQENNS